MFSDYAKTRGEVTILTKIPESLYKLTLKIFACGGRAKTRGELRGIPLMDDSGIVSTKFVPEVGCLGKELSAL